MRDDCAWHPDADGYVSLQEMLTNADCALPPAIKGFSVAEVVVDKHGHQLDGDHDDKARHGCDHRESAEWQAEHRAKKAGEIMEQEVSTEATSLEPPVALALNDAAALPAQPAATVESVGVDAAVAQVKSLVPADTSPALLIGGAAALAVIGAGVKFGPQVLKSRAEKAEREHELEMERLKLERERSEKQDDQHKACSVERAMLEAKVGALQAKLDVLESKAEKAGAASLSMEGFDPEQLEERLAKIEKKLKQPPTKGRKKA